MYVGVSYSVLFLVFSSLPSLLGIYWIWKSKARTLLSPSTFFFLGLLFFQSISPFNSLLTNDFYEFSVQDPYFSSGLFLIYLYAFSIPFLSINFRRRKMSSSPYVGTHFKNPRRLLRIASLCLLIGTTFSYLAGEGNGAYTHLLSLGSFALLGGASTLSGMVVGRKSKIFGFFLIPVLGILAISLYFAYDGIFGRRPLLSVLLGFIFGYVIAKNSLQRESIWNAKLSLNKPAAGENRIGETAHPHELKKRSTQAKRPTKKSYAAVWFFAICSAVLMIFVSGSRTHTRDVLAGEQQINVSVETFSSGWKQLMSGQDAGAVSFWLIENVPDTVKPEYLSSLLYAVIYPAPRDLWKDKPIPLSSRVHYEAGLRTFLEETGSTRGPGIVGHGVADGGWVVLILYGLLLGYFLRKLDDYVSEGRPFHCLIGIGATLGYVMSFARGDLGSAIWRSAFMFTVVTLIARILFTSYKFSSNNYKRSIGE